MKKFTVYSLGGLIRDYECCHATDAYILFVAYLITDSVFDTIDYIKNNEDGKMYQFKSCSVELVEIDNIPYELTKEDHQIIAEHFGNMMLENPEDFGLI